MKIPKEFTVGGVTYHITMVDTSEEMYDRLGDFCEVTQEIRIARTSKVDDVSKIISEDLALETYFHELGHCFGVYYGNDHGEELACAFSHFMMEYFKSVKE